MRWFALLVLFACVSHGARCAHDLSHIVESVGVDPQRSALRIVRLEDAEEWTSGQRCIYHTYSPGCTRNIPYTLAALEEGVVAERSFQWDGEKRWKEDWNQDQTLRSAFHRSAVWVYEQIVASIGEERLCRQLRQMGYGNTSTGASLADLEVSAHGQVEFLKQVVSRALALSEETYLQSRCVFCERSSEQLALFGKTGWTQGVGWYVGWVEAGEETFIFAFNMELREIERAPLRKTVIFACLKELGLDL